MLIRKSKIKLKEMFLFSKEIFDIVGEIAIINRLNQIIRNDSFFKLIAIEIRNH